MKSIYDKIVYIYGRLVDMIKASTPAGYPALVEKVDGIDACVPDQADADNQLADKEFVNSSIATSTATFRGTYVLTGLGLDDPFSATHVDVAAAVQATLDRLGRPYDGSDYVFVQVPQNPQPEDADPDSPAMSRVDRYKCVETGADPVAKSWEYEWTLNNSSFTAAQWAAIVSGITSGLVAKLKELPTAEALAQALAGKADKSDVDPLLFAQYYPDGSVKSAAEFTSGIKYDAPDTTARTITVKPFYNTGTAAIDNSSLVGRVVIPPFVDAQGNGYISDDGTRFKVVGVSGFIESFSENTNLTAIVVPSTVTTIGVSAFAHCSALASVSLPAVQSIGSYAFFLCTSLTDASLPAAQGIGSSAFLGCISLTSVDFGDTPRSSVPTLEADAFNLVPTSCKIIVPDAQYDEWIAATLPDGSSNRWYTLVTKGYKFLRHSEWEYARKYELDGKLDKMTAIAWSDLKAKRDGSLLVPGQQYRITDYVATTNGDMESQSANHRFDIIVTADDERTLNEHARAIIHEGDLPDDIVDGETRTKYFAGCDLAAWDVWYCLDNDTTRFAWADATNGKGVIYRLVDEFGNDAPYDFKGIQFRRWAVTDVTSTKFDVVSLENLKSSFVKAKNGGLYYVRQSSNTTINGTTLVVDGSDSVWYYTFGGAEDLSRAGFANAVYANEIAEYVTGGSCRLNNIIFRGPYCHGNTFGLNCFSNTFGAGCSSNTFGEGCSSNAFGLDCFSNAFGAGCSSNTFGEGCSSNAFGTGCSSNTFGTDCRKNTFYSSCSSNAFGTGCSSNTFGRDCSSNTFGRFCPSNTFGTGCSSNVFGTGCSSNTFGQRCHTIRFGTASAVKSYCYAIRVGTGNHHLYINPTGTTSGSQPYQNVEIKEGVNNTDTYKTIDDPNVGQTFLTTYKPADSQEVSL